MGLLPPSPAWLCSCSCVLLGFTCAFKSSRASARSLRDLKRELRVNDTRQFWTSTWDQGGTQREDVHQEETEALPHNALPRGSIRIVLLLRVQTDVLLVVQLEPVQQSLPVPAHRLQPHPLWILIIYCCLKLQVVIKLTLTQVLKDNKTAVDRMWSGGLTRPSKCTTT